VAVSGYGKYSIVPKIIQEDWSAPILSFAIGALAKSLDL
jgi:hypothetical protein